MGGHQLLEEERRLMFGLAIAASLIAGVLIAIGSVAWPKR
jgi:hypothetical protein